MSFEKILEELKTLKDMRPEICEKIKSHNLPVIIFGAAETAMRVTNILKSHGVEIAGYAVDKEYFKPNQTYLNCPVYNFAELSATPEKYVFVLGCVSNGSDSAGMIAFLKDTKINKYAFNLSTVAQNLNYEYISANREKFAEIFSLLADELSKKSMIEFFKLKITYDLKYNLETYHSSQYFNEVTNGVRTPNGGGTWIAARLTAILLKNLLIGAAAITQKFLQLRQTR